MNKPLPLGATIGILGGGQLGRMLATAAARLGFKSHIYDPVPGGPAQQVAHAATIADYKDVTALRAFAKAVDVVTYEFENIPTLALDEIEGHKPVFPPRQALATSQDRLNEKQFLNALGLRVAPYANIEDQDHLAVAIAQTGAPAILKTRRFGYDGKGQIRVASIGDLADAWDELGNTACVLEGMVRFEQEISIIATRAPNGDIAVFDPGENVHNNGILHSTTVPAKISDTLRADATRIASMILDGLGYVGTIGVELFVTSDGLIINEFAPRVHNSGHWTQNATACDQFEQHIRAIAGWPLGDTTRFADVEMINLIGNDIENWSEFAQQTGTAIHLYGKSEAKEGRKMGHINYVRPIR